MTGDKHWLPGAKSVLSQLHDRGLRLGLITNTGNLTRAQFLKLLPADFNLDLFAAELVILSSEVHIEKPDPMIFKLALQRAAAEATACLFCTEDLLHTLVAQSVGMRAARLQAPPQSDIGTLVEHLTKAGLLAV